MRVDLCVSILCSAKLTPISNLNPLLQSIVFTFKSIKLRIFRLTHLQEKESNKSQ